MKTLILGSQGFIGGHLASFCLSKGYAVVGCDLSEQPGTGYRYQKVSILSPDFDTLCSKERFDLCINASGSGNVPFSVINPLSDFEANSTAVAKVLDTIRKYQPDCKYVHISSAAVYGNPPSLPVHEGMPLHPLSPYGWHKLISEMLCSEYHKLYGLQVAIIRPFSVYGNGLRKQLLWDVCNKIQQEKTISLFGTGKESRDFIHIRDLCHLLDCVVEKSKFNAEIYNAANGAQVTIETIVALLTDNFGTEKRVAFNGESRVGDPLYWEADISKVVAMGYRPLVALETGVREYVTYFKDYMAAI
jgi:UDP-glucose 4-epimerase